MRKAFKRVIYPALVAAFALYLAVCTPVQLLAKGLLSAEGLDAECVREVLASRSALTASNGAGGTACYISDIKTATAETKEEARRLLRNAGYIVLDQDLNLGAEDGRPCLIGYKVTTDRDQAITGLNTMEMSGGYQFKKYRDILDEMVPGIVDTTSGFMAACHELKRLVKAKDPVAEYAYHTLNILCVPESAEARTGMPLGDYLIADDRTFEDYKTLLLVCRSDLFSFINNLLATGLSGCIVNDDEEGAEAYVSDPNWIPRTAKAAAEMLQVLSEDELRDLLDAHSESAYLLQCGLREELSAVGERYLKEVSLKDIPVNGGDSYRTAYDFFLSSDEELMACVIEALPESVTGENFVETLEEFLTPEHSQMIRKTLAPLPEIVSPWMRDMVTRVNENANNPYTAGGLQKLLSDNAGKARDNGILVELITDFVKNYRTQRDKFEELRKKAGSSATFSDVVRSYEALVDEVNRSKEEGEEPDSDLILYMGAYTVLNQYKIDKKDWLVLGGRKCESLAEYFELIADAKGEVQQALAYALTSVLPEAQLYTVKAASLPMFILNGVLDPRKTNEFDKQYRENVTNLRAAYAKAGFAENECSVWFGTNYDLLDNEGLALTSASVRADATGDELLKAYDSMVKDAKTAAWLSESVEICGIAMGVAGFLWAAGSFGMLLITGSGILSGVSAMITAGFGTIAGLEAVTGLSAMGVAVSCAGAFGFIGFLVVMAIFLVYFIIQLAGYSDITDDLEIEYTDIPTVMLDAKQDLNGKTLSACRYDVVTDIGTGKPTDLNDRERTGARRWLALYYSREETAGSPLVVNPETNTLFEARVDTFETPAKTIPLAKFGGCVPYNLNSYNDSTDKAVYLFYSTENSLAGIVDMRTPGKYIYDMILSVGKSDKMAKDYILCRSDYGYLDVNLTPGTGFYTYIGYRTTNDETKAVTDIRADFGSTATKVVWGKGNNYINLFNEEQTVCPLTTVYPEETLSHEKGVFQTPFCYQLYISKSAAVGDPILADSLRVVNKLRDVEDGYEYVRWFSGGGFDFRFRTGVMNDDGASFGSFLTYAPEEKYRVYQSSEEEYLAGIAFFVGLRDDSWWSERSPLNSARHYAEMLGYQLLDVDLAAGTSPLGEVELKSYNDHETDDAERELCLGYAVTKNPKKAVTEIGTFTGEPKGDGGLNSSIIRSGVGFNAAQLFSIDKLYIHGSQYNDTHRDYMVSGSFTHAYLQKYTKDTAYSEETDWDRRTVIARPQGLYIAGPQAGMRPIKTSDVLYSTGYLDFPRVGGEWLNSKIYSLKTGSRVSGNLTAGWKTVHSLDRYFYDEYDSDGNLSRCGANLGVSRDVKAGKDAVLYLFYRNESAEEENGSAAYDTVSKAKYIASAEIVGSLQENAAYDSARYLAMSYGQEIINLTAPLFTKAGERYDVTNETLVGWLDENGNIVSPTYTDKCYYIAVSYQDESLNAVSSLRIAYQDGKKELPEVYTFSYADDAEALYEKGQSVAPTLPEKKTGGKTQKSGTNTDTVKEGYVLYHATHVGQASRIEVLENGAMSGNNTGMGRRFVENLDGSIFAAGDGTKQSIALYSPLGRYIYKIAVVKGDSPTEAEVKLSQRGFTEVIYADALVKATGVPVTIGIMRTDTAFGAIQDIRVAYKDLGEEPEIDGLYYMSVEGGSLDPSSPVYLYYTTGTFFAAIGWGELTAVTNLGLRYQKGNLRGNTVTFWNGVQGMNEYPDGLDKKSAVLDVLDNKADILYDSKLTAAKLNQEAFDRQVGEVNRTLGSQAAEAYKMESGYSWLVFTNNCDYYYAEFSDMVFSGEIELDPENPGVWTASTVNPAAALWIVIAGIALAGTVTILAIYLKRKKAKEKKS